MNRLSLCIVLSATLYVAQAYPTRNSDPVNKEIVLGSSNDDLVVFEGDMLMTEEDIQDLKTSKNGINDNRRRWPYAEVFYQVDGKFSDEQLETMERARQLISSRTCVTFTLRENDERNYISFKHPNNSASCSSEVGMNPSRGQVINYPDWCLKEGPGSVAHELIHALGFYHEQSRIERDDYVKINFDNLENPKYRNNFDKYQTDGFGVPYDYGSIMHYSATAFGKTVNGKKLETITVRKPGAEIGQRKDLSQGDIDKIKKMYNC